MSYHDDLGMKSLIGVHVKNALINEKHDYVYLDTDQGPFHLTWEGDCCSECFLAHIAGVDALIGHIITDVEEMSWIGRTEKQEDNFAVKETMGTKITTDKGYVTFESRLEHNGYYGGRIMVSRELALNQYHDNRYESGVVLVMKLLLDF